MSVINKFLTDYYTAQQPREWDVPSVRLDYVTLRTAAATATAAAQEEAVVRLAAVPLSVNIDQDALNFLVKFFSFAPPPWPALTQAAVTVAPTFFKLCVIESLQVTVDYQPKRVKYSALLRGQFEELLGLVRAAVVLMFFHLFFLPFPSPLDLGKPC